MRKDGEGQGQTTRGFEKSDPPVGAETSKSNVRLPKPGDSERNGRSSPDWRNIFLYFIPIPISLALIVILAVLDVKLVFDPPGLLLVLNTCFISLLPFLVAFIAMKGYLSSGSISLIMLAAGCLSLGLGSILAGFMPLTHLGVNGVVAIHNSSALLSSVFQVLGVASALVGLPPQQDRRRKKLYVLSLFLGISGFAALLTITSVYGVGPVFFLQGSGPTPLRQTVLGAATAMFLVSGLLLGAMYLRSGSRFLFFYCMALFLIAEGLFCISIQKAVGSPIGWLGRGLQYLAGIYLLVAILEARSELVVRGLRLDVGIAKLLRHHLEPLVDQRTEELARVNNELRQEITERERAEESLKRAKEELEVRVQERTTELKTSNKELHREIDERKVSEEALRDSENRLSSYLNTINEMGLGVFVVDRNYKVRHMNPTMVRWFGDHPGKVCYESVAGLSAPCPYCQLNNVINESKVVHYEPSTPDGRTFSVVAAPVRENDGSISKMEIIADITDRKRAEERLSRISSMVSDIAYSCIKLPAGAYSIDWLTGGAERVTGYSIDDLKSLGCWRSLVLDDDLPVFDNHVIGLAPGTTGSCELRLRHKTGGIVWIASFAECAVVPESPDSLRLYGGLVDITDRKISEELIRIRLALLEFARSHSLEELLQKTLDEVGTLTGSPIGSTNVGRMLATEQKPGRLPYDAISPKLKTTNQIQILTPC